MFVLKVSHFPAFKKIMTEKILWHESPTPLKIARSGVRFKNFSWTPDVQISKFFFYQIKHKILGLFTENFGEIPKTPFFKYRKPLFFRWKSQKTSCFGLAFFRVYIFFGLDKYFPDFLCKKFHCPPKNTLRDLRGTSMTHTSEKLRWIFIPFLVIYYVKYEAKNVNCRSWCTPSRGQNFFRENAILLHQGIGHCTLDQVMPGIVNKNTPCPDVKHIE